MITKYFKGRLDTLLDHVIRIFPDHKYIPNIITLIGLFFSLLGGISFAYNFFRIGGIFILVAGLCDIIDGTYARIFNRASNFGAFIDSTSDRYADMFILSGLGIQFALKQNIGYLILTLVTIIGFVMVSYTKARAENIIPKCDVGIMERPERIILLIIGALTLKIKLCLWILAVMTHITALQRIRYTYNQTEVKGMKLKEVI